MGWDRGKEGGRGDVTMRKRPKESVNPTALPLSAAVIPPSMLKPPGVRMMAKAIQKPP